VRVVLLTAPSPEPLNGPLLGLQCVAAALLARGHDVAVLDLAAAQFRHDAGWIEAEVDRLAPDVVGMGLYTRWAWHGYRLAERLARPKRLLVAGGPHATAYPREPIRFGFDTVVAGEGEVAFPEIVESYGRGARPPRIVVAPAIGELDALPFPHLAQRLYNPAWYGASEAGTAGLMLSRGCPSRCTFCANHVTGRKLRWRSPASVVAELNACHALTGARFIPFWDDAFTAHAGRVIALCAALERGLDFALQFSAVTRATMAKPNVLAALRRAGCLQITFGVESGDREVLQAIRKGISLAAVVRALDWAKAAGLRTACTFMFGFPGETPGQLESTLRFMESIAPLVDAFGAHGVVVPLPGTPIYDRFHDTYGFTEWWLREDVSYYRPFPPLTDFRAFCERYIQDPHLDLDFFRYSAETRAMITACLRFKGEHNLRRMGLLPPWP
jgi:radical SAM superfamily enzyme YgiQ (UPF0313 family)